MNNEEKSIRQIWNELDDGAEPITEREKMVAQQREKWRSSLSEIGNHLTSTIQSTTEVLQDRMLAPLRLAEKIQKDWAKTVRKLAKYVKQHREEFDERYEAYYPQMKGYLRRKLDLRDDEEPTLPISTDDMWELWIYEIAPYADWSRNLEIEDFIEAHKIIEQSLDEKLPNAIEKSKSLIPEYIERAIHKAALEISKNSPVNDYEKIYNTLELYYSTDLNGEDTAKKADIPPNTFSTWKKNAESKM